MTDTAPRGKRTGYFASEPPYCGARGPNDSVCVKQRGHSGKHYGQVEFTGAEVRAMATEFGLAANGAQQALADTGAYLRVMDVLRQSADAIDALAAMTAERDEVERRIVERAGLYRIAQDWRLA